MTGTPAALGRLASERLPRMKLTGMSKSGMQLCRGRLLAVEVLRGGVRGHRWGALRGSGAAAQSYRFGGRRPQEAGEQGQEGRQEETGARAEGGTAKAQVLQTGSDRREPQEGHGQRQVQGSGRSSVMLQLVHRDRAVCRCSARRGLQVPSQESS